MRTAFIVLIILIAIVLPAQAQEADVYPIPADVVSDCSVDVTDAIDDWITAVPDGATLVFGENACYQVNGTLTLIDRKGLTLDGNGATFQVVETPLVEAGDRSERKHIYCQNSEEMTFRNFTLRGTNTEPDSRFPDYSQYLSPYESEHGISLHACRNVLIEGVTIDAVYGDGILIGGYGPLEREGDNPASQNVVLLNVTISRNGRQGIALTWADTVLLDHVLVANSRRSAIDIEPAAVRWAVTNVEIRNADFMARNAAIAATGLGSVRNVHFHNSIVRRTGKPRIAVRDKPESIASDWIIEEVVFEADTYAEPVMLFDGVENVTIRNNVAPMSVDRVRVGVLLKNPLGLVEITGNDWGDACQGYVVTGEDRATYVTDGNILRADCPVVEVPTPTPAETPTPEPTPTEMVTETVTSTPEPTETPVLVITDTPLPAMVECAAIWFRAGRMWCEVIP